MALVAFNAARPAILLSRQPQVRRAPVVRASASPVAAAAAAPQCLKTVLPVLLQSIVQTTGHFLRRCATISSSSSSVVTGGPLFFATMTTTRVTTPLTVVASGMAKWLELYSAVMMVRVLLSWFPNIPWEKQPFMAIRDMCDPYLNLFRNIIPPVFNALDLSPLLAFMVLGTLATILNSAR